MIFPSEAALAGVPHDNMEPHPWKTNIAAIFRRNFYTSRHLRLQTSARSGVGTPNTMNNSAKQ